MFEKLSKKLEHAEIQASSRAFAYWVDLKDRVKRGDGQASMEYSTILVVVGIGVIGILVTFRDKLIEKLQYAISMIDKAK